MPDDVAVKHDAGKTRTDLLPPGPLNDIADIFTFGAAKYSDRNWEKGFNYGRPYGALLRHLFAWWSGEDNDPETDQSHLAHAGCNLLMLLEFSLHSHKGVDDRPAKGEEEVAVRLVDSITRCVYLGRHSAHYMSSSSPPFGCPGRTVDAFEQTRS